MEALCRITLMEPFRGNEAAQIRLGDGQRSLVPMGAVGSISDPAFHVGFNSEQKKQFGINEEDQNRFKAAQDVVYDLGLGVDNSIIVPVSCAQRWFGDWTIKPGSRDQRGTKRTFAQERERVAGVWGDFKRMPRGKKTNNGVQPDTRKIGAPDVPHVKIEVLEQNGHPYGDAFLPWEYYRWQDDVDATAVKEAKLIAMEDGVPMLQPQAQQAALDLSKLSKAQLRQLAGLLADELKHDGAGTQA